MESSGSAQNSVFGSVAAIFGIKIARKPINRGIEGYL